MATREQYLAQGKTNAEIDAALAARNQAPAVVAPTTQNTKPPAAPDMSKIQTADSGFAGSSAEIAANKAKYQAEQAAKAAVQSPAPAQPPVQAPAPAPVAAPATVSAPPVIQAPAPTVQAPAPVKAAAPAKTPAAPVTNPQEYYDQSQKREQEILSNLDTGFKNDPTLFRDENTFKSSYGYATADEGKKRMLDAYWQSKQPKGENQFADILMSGGTVWNETSKRTPDYQRAQSRFDVVSQYKGADSQSLFSSMVNGKITPSSEAYSDLVKLNGGVETPAMLEAKAKYEKKKLTDNINRGSAILSSAASGKETAEGKSHSEVLGDDIVARKGIDYAQSYKDEVANNPELAKLNEELSATSLQIKELERQKADTMKGIISQYKGITTGAAMLLANQQNEAIDKNLNQLYDRQANQNANLTYKTNIAEKAFDYKIDQDKLDRAEASQIASETRQFERQKDLAKYSQELALDTSKKEFEQKMEQQAAIAKDPVSATKAVIDQYREKGIFAQRSDADIIASVQNDVASGMTLGQSLTNLNKAFQSKPEYQAAIAPKVDYKEFG